MNNIIRLRLCLDLRAFLRVNDAGRRERIGSQFIDKAGRKPGVLKQDGGRAASVQGKD